MDNRIELLRKIQKYMNDMQYPGYAFQTSVVYDGKSEVSFIDVEELAVDIDELNSRVSAPTAYYGLGCEAAVKQTWLTPGSMPKASEIINAKDEDFYVESIQIVKFYFALFSAIREVKGTDRLVLASVDLENEWVDCRIFETEEEIKTYIKDYFPEDFNIEEQK